MALFRRELGRQFDELAVGDASSVSRRVTEQDILQYMGVSGDLNPLYADKSYAGRTRYQRPIVPANLLAGFAAGAVASVLPGPGTVTLSHAYRLEHPPGVGDEITAHLEVAELDPARREALIRYRLTDQDGRQVMLGEMRVEPPSPLRPILDHAFENF